MNEWSQGRGRALALTWLCDIHHVIYSNHKHCNIVMNTQMVYKNKYSLQCSHKMKSYPDLSYTLLLYKIPRDESRICQPAPSAHKCSTSCCTSDIPQQSTASTPKCPERRQENTLRRGKWHSKCLFDEGDISCLKIYTFS